MQLDPELEARLIEQEHRVVRVVQNYFDRKKWPVDDPRRSAARNAVLWRVMAPGTAAIAAGGTVAAATLFVLVWQTRLIAEQNEAFKEQNQKLQTQIDQQADQDTARRRTEIISVLYETTQGVSRALEPRANPRTRAEAALEFVRLERQRLAKLRQRGPDYQQQVSLTQARLDGLNLDSADFSEVSFVGAFLENTSFHRANLIGADFRASQLVSTSFRNAALTRANFEASPLLQVSLAHADLREARLNSATLADCEVLGADMRGADLTGLRAGDKPTVFRYVNIAGVKGLEPQLRARMLADGAVELSEDAAWQAFRSEKGLR